MEREYGGSRGRETNHHSRIERPSTRSVLQLVGMEGWLKTTTAYFDMATYIEFVKKVFNGLLVAGEGNRLGRHVSCSKVVVKSHSVENTAWDSRASRNCPMQSVNVDFSTSYFSTILHAGHRTNNPSDKLTIIQDYQDRPGEWSLLVLRIPLPVSPRLLQH